MLKSGSQVLLTIRKKEGLRDCTGFTFETWKIHLFFYIQSVEREEIVIEIATVAIISD